MSTLGNAGFCINNHFQVDPTSSAGAIMSGIQYASGNDRHIIMGNSIALLNGGTNNAGNLAIGILISTDAGSQGSGVIVASNRIAGTQNTIQAFGIGVNNSPGGSKIYGNSIELGLSQALGGDGINLAPVTASTGCSVMHNTVRRTGAAATMRYGINLPAGANNHLVVHNDLRTSGGTASLNNAGAGNFLNMDGSANNWNLL